MDFSSNLKQKQILVAKAADLCMKPWKHSAILQDQHELNEISTKELSDLRIIIECRNEEGHRKKDRDLELEIYKSGDELNIILMWVDQPNKPILWHGKHSVWMDGTTGKVCQCPHEGIVLESLARKIKSSIDLFD